VILDSGTKIRLILKGASAPVSEIKLIRTDTTLDLSQKAEKVCGQRVLEPSPYRTELLIDFMVVRLKQSNTTLVRNPQGKQKRSSAFRGGDVCVARLFVIEE
jgi:hypothetical protein